MNPIRCLLSTLALAAVCLGTQANADHHEEAEAMTLQSLVTGEHRSADNIARNAWRHPVETLKFFGLEADTTVIEILPSTGWYTEIIAPYVRDQGKYYAAHFSPNAAQDFMPRIRGLFEEKISSDPDHYGRITVRSLNPRMKSLLPPG